MRNVPLLLLLVLAGACADRTPPAEPPPRAHPLAQDGTTERAITSAPDRVRVQLDLAAVRTAVKAHHSETGSWPASLAEVPVEGLSYPADLTYDPSTGKVGSATYPSF